MFLGLMLILLHAPAFNRAQECLLASHGNRHLPNFVRPGGGTEPQFRDQPIQVIITSYRFSCCGVVTEWRAFVERSGGGHVSSQPYTISFQVWRPNSLSPVDTDGCYTMAGVNHFSPIPLADHRSPDRGIVTGRPAESERIEVQPGDVVGFYLVSTRNDDDGIQFARDRDNTSPYTDESVWFATNSINTGGPTCQFPVGTSGTLSSSTNLAPLITATVSMSDCPESTAIQPSATRHNPTPTPTPSTLSHEVSTPTPSKPPISTVPPHSQEVPSSIPTPPSPESSTNRQATATLVLALTRPTPILTDTSTPGIDGGADNTRLYVGIAIIVLCVLVVGIPLVVLVIVLCKWRSKQKGLEMVYYSGLHPGGRLTLQNAYYSRVDSAVFTRRNIASGRLNTDNRTSEHSNDLPSAPSSPTTDIPTYDYISTSPTTAGIDSDDISGGTSRSSYVKLTKNVAYSYFRLREEQSPVHTRVSGNHDNSNSYVNAEPEETNTRMTEYEAYENVKKQSSTDSTRESNSVSGTEEAYDYIENVTQIGAR